VSVSKENGEVKKVHTIATYRAKERSPSSVMADGSDSAEIITWRSLKTSISHSREEEQRKGHVEWFPDLVVNGLSR
jgi:hypothetical protein